VPAAALLAAVALASPGHAPAPAQRWEPPAGARFQYQLESADRSNAATGGIDVGICNVPATGGPCVRPQVFDIDLYEDGRISGNDHTVNTAAVSAIHRRGGHAVCYVSAGTAERFRPDYRKYVRFDRRIGHRLLGRPFSDRFSNEYWVNINNGRGQRDFVLRRVAARTRKCADAGFDAVEYDVLDAYAQGRRVTGWRIGARTQLRFDRALARIAHRDGLSAGLKNDLGQVPKLEPRFDFAINEQCFQYHECRNNPSPGYRAFTRAGKAVFQVEYRIPTSRFCARANGLGFSSIKKARDFSLDAEPWTPCR
jgi:endo-alpha-1,4-polygalactosaminidase (GH114 family)